MNLEGKNILVTGAAGLVGSNLTQALRNIPDVNLTIIVHNKILGSHYNVDSSIRGDLLDESFCQTVTLDQDIVFHCAAKSYGAAVMEAEPLRLVKDNLLMNINVLEACHKNDVKKLIWLASTTGYPDTGDNEVVESMMFEGEPHDKYYAVGWVKRYTEILCKLFSEKLKKSLPCVVLRPTNIYGPNDKTDLKTSHVLPALMHKVIKKHNPIEVWGDGKDERDVIYVDDMVKAMIIAAEKIDHFDQFNIGCGQTYPILDILKEIQKIANYEAPIKLVPSGPSMIRLRKTNIDKAKRILGWSPTTPLSVGLEKTYNWMKDVI